MVFTDRWLPELRDPEYGCKLELLWNRLAQNPGAPLTVFLGSSRSGLGIRPEALPQSPGSGGTNPVVFNLAMTGGGPILELLSLRRLLGAGIHPREAIIEVMPALIYQEGLWMELNWFPVERMSFDDLTLLSTYTPEPWRMRAHWIRSNVAPCFSNRFALMTRYAPGWLVWNSRQDGWHALDSSGWLPYRDPSGDGNDNGRALKVARKEYYEVLQRIRLTPIVDRAFHELLDLCRHEHIAVTLLLMPEGSQFQSWYPPAARANIDQYVAQLSREFALPVIDARSWMPDAAFVDSHHLSPAGAKSFTERLGREVLLPRWAERDGLMRGAALTSGR